MQEGHLAIGYISGGRSTDDFLLSVMGAMMSDKRITDVICQKGPYIPHNKNEVVRTFLALPSEPEWLLMIDNDEQFPRWGPGKVMEIAKKIGAKIVGCNYTQTNYSDGFYRQNRAGLYDPVMPLEANRIYRDLDAIAGGFNLVHREVYTTMREKYPPVYPWYWHDFFINSEGTEELPGEDFTFCRRAKASGFSIYGFTGIPIVHLKEQQMLPKYMAPLVANNSGEHRDFLHASNWG